MKKLLSLTISFLVLISAFVIPTFAEDEIFSADTIEYYKNLGLQGTVLNVYNWGEYIDDEEVDVISEFERLTGCDVNYTTFESNENMYSKLSGGGVSYDIIIPSDYMVERLISEDMLLPLDYENIPNYQKFTYTPHQPLTQTAVTKLGNNATIQSKDGKITSLEEADLYWLKDKYHLPERVQEVDGKFQATSYYPGERNHGR